MGWDYNFTLDSQDWSSSREILPKIMKMMLIDNTFLLKRMEVYSYGLLKANRGDLTKSVLASFEASTGLPLPVIDRWVNQFDEPGTLFDVVFHVLRYTSNGKYVKREVHLYAFDDQFIGYPGSTGLTYDSHSSKLYSSILNPDFSKNISLLLAELEVFVASGITTIRGLHGYQDETNIKTHSLCYHQDVLDFVSDLHQIDPRLTNVESIGQDDILSIIGMCESVSGKKMQNGVIVWSEKGTDGSLSEFYNSLLAWVVKSNEDKKGEE